MNESNLEALNNHLREVAIGMGASHYGIADLSRFYAVWPKSFVDYGKLLIGVSILVPENSELLNGLPQTDDKSRTSHYNIKVALGQQIAERLSGILVERGYAATVHKHPPSKTAGPTGLLKAAGRLAGFGWIGKNRLLITPDYGPRIAPALVLTDAPFTPSAAGLIQPVLEGCGSCTRCIEICPGHAFSYEPFGETDSLNGFNIGQCSAIRGIINPTGWGACSLCVQACPFGAGHRDRAPAFHDAFPFVAPMESESPL